MNFRGSPFITRIYRTIGFFFISLLALLVTALQPIPVYAEVNILHSFLGSPSDGQIPLYGPLILNNSKFYGVTSEGGVVFGTVFSINPDGTGYTVLHEFDPSTDGTNPYGGIVQSGSKFYGMTNFGGGNADSLGVIYSINTDGTGYTVLHDFDGGGNDGGHPSGSLIVIGSELYGTTVNGGDNDMGVVFSINTDGSGFTLLHEFSGTDGQGPFNTLTRNGSKLYGTTGIGGANNFGTIFSINTDGSGFTILHEFAGEPTDGSLPQAGGDLLLNGSTLFGTTINGGTADGGVLFKINTDGSGYSVLHEFTAGGEGDHGGSNPYGTPIVNGTTLYGTTSRGGDSNLGTLYSINIDGSDFTVLHEFSGGLSDGATPYTTLTLYNSTLYGLSSQGGSDDDLGTIYSYTLSPDPTPSSTPAPTQRSSSSPSAPSCGASTPVGSPYIFQVNVNNSQAKLYFTPVANANNYFIAFGRDLRAEGYGATLHTSDTSGVLSYTINALSPNTTYYLKVRGGNGCSPGNWSNTLMIKTGRSKTSGKSYYPTFASRFLSIFKP